MTALSTGESYSYDANGNMTSRTEGGSTYTQTFDAENRLVSVAVSGQTTQFLYDPDGNLVKKINPDGSKTLYVGGIYEVNKSSGGTVTSTKTYYPLAGAMRVNSTLYFVLKDHLGSASVVTDSMGTTVGEDRFYPFGETRFTTGNMQTDKLFTGQRQITGLGVYNYGARFYSPLLGRFLSADTIVPGYSDPQNFNRYSYVRNNPIKYNDPTGHGVDCGIGTNCVTKPGTMGVAPNPATYICYYCSKPKPSHKTNNNTGGGSDPQNMETSKEGENFIKYWENAGGPPNQYPYEDMGGTCTIGWGHVLPNGRDGCSGGVKKFYRDNPLSPKGAEDFLEQDIDNAEIVIKETITADLTQAQFDALVSYVFNVGKDKYNTEKKIPELINSGNYEAAAAAIASGPITSDNKESDKLKERRQAEAALFVDGTYVP